MLSEITHYPVILWPVPDPQGATVRLRSTTGRHNRHPDASCAGFEALQPVVTMIRVGRRKQIGRGEGSSGLRFDFV
jgi:hypothetical protein